MRRGTWRKAGSIARSNLVRFLRDRSNYFFVFLFPIGLILILGLSFGGDGGTVIGVTAGDDALSQRFVASLEAQPEVTVARVDDPAELRDRVERGALLAGVVVPPDLGASLAAGEDPELTFLSTGGEGGARFQLVVASAMSQVGERVRAARYLADTTDLTLATALERVDAAAAASPGPRVRQEWVGETAFGDDIQAFDIGAGSQLVLFVFLTGLTSASALIQSRKLGVSRRMLASPTSSATILLGEALGRYLVALFQGAYIILATWLVFGVDWGEPVAAIVLLVVFAAVAASAGMLIGAVFNSDQAASGVSVLLGLSLAALGGAMLPLELFGHTLRTVARFVPHSWAVDAYGELMRHGGTLLDIMPQLGVLAAFAVGLFLLATWRFRRRLREA